MNKKSKYFIGITISLIFLVFIEIVYLKIYEDISTIQLDEKKAFLKVTALPDLAISTEAMFIRHRTLSDTFSVLKESPELREYFPSTFTYSHSHILNNTPSKVINEK